MSDSAEFINNGTTAWSDINSWSTLTGAPLASWNVTFESGSYTSLLDTAFVQPGLSIPSLGTIFLSTGDGVTLDIQKSVTIAAITGSTDGATDQGLLEIGNGATVTDTLSGLDDFNSTSLYVGGDGLAQGLLEIQGTIDNGSVITLNDVNFDSTVGIIDETAHGGVVPADLTLEGGATWTAQSTEAFNAGSLVLAGGGIANLGALQLGDLDFVVGRTTIYPQISMAGLNNELVLPKTVDAGHVTITAFGATDKIEIEGFTPKSESYSGDQLSLWSGANDTGTLVALTDFTLAAGANPAFTTGTDALGTYVELASCFAPGTRVLTSAGEVNVEDLREGDLVITQTEGGSKAVPVIWIGHRKLDLTRHPYPQMVAPIRVRRGALADNVPHRDLVLSPDHSIFIDGALVPAKLLVNGRTIVREMPDAVEYFHLECGSHTIILAEGLTVETYLDTGDRAVFDNAGTTLSLHPRLEINSAVKSWADACAPLVTDAAVAEPIWQWVADRASQLGHVAADVPATSDDPQLHLLVNGSKLRPIGVKDDKYIFVLPRGVREVTLLSDTVCPADERPWTGDLRRLGVAIREFVFRGDGDAGSGDFLVMSADDSSMSRGWWPPENDGVTFWRWTDGAGVIPLAIVSRILEVKIVKMARYPVAWSASAAVQAA
jgi:hypothetical protein